MTPNALDRPSVIIHGGGGAGRGKGALPHQSINWNNSTVRGGR